MRTWRLETPDCPECHWQIWVDDDLVLEYDEEDDIALLQFIVDACNEKERREAELPQGVAWVDDEGKLRTEVVYPTEDEVLRVYRERLKVNDA